MDKTHFFGSYFKCALKLSPIIIVPRIDNENDVKSHKEEYSCANCALNFKRKFELQNHKCLKEIKRREFKTILQKYKILQNRTQCRLCFKWFSSKERRNRHVTILHRKCVECSKCGLVFVDAITFIEHYKSLHRNVKSLQEENNMSPNAAKDVCKGNLGCGI